LAGFSLLLSIIVGIPLGIVASRGGAVGHVILGFASVVQTIPSLALLALLVPLPFFGISVRTAIAALFLYGLLPIVRNTATGLQDIPRTLRESQSRLDSAQPHAFGKFICRWHRDPSSPESKPAP
jgi:osmoprotectant transport system permease protein